MKHKLNTASELLDLFAVSTKPDLHCLFGRDFKDEIKIKVFMVFWNNQVEIYDLETSEDRLFLSYDDSLPVNNVCRSDARRMYKAYLDLGWEK